MQHLYNLANLRQLFGRYKQPVIEGQGQFGAKLFARYLLYVRKGLQQNLFVRGRCQRHVNKPQKKKINEVNAEGYGSGFGQQTGGRQLKNVKVRIWHRCYWLTVNWFLGLGGLCTSSCSLWVDLSLVFCNIPFSSSILWRVLCVLLRLCLFCISSFFTTKASDASGLLKCSSFQYAWLELFVWPLNSKADRRSAQHNS